MKIQKTNDMKYMQAIVTERKLLWHVRPGSP